MVLLEPGVAVFDFDLCTVGCLHLHRMPQNIFKLQPFGETLYHQKNHRMILQLLHPGFPQYIFFKFSYREQRKSGRSVASHFASSVVGTPPLQPAGATYTFRSGGVFYVPHRCDYYSESFLSSLKDYCRIGRLALASSENRKRWLV